MPPRSRTAVDVDENMPIEQLLCRSLTGHQWNFKANTAEQFGRNLLVRIPCMQCGKTTSILMNMRGELQRGRQYTDPKGWVHDKDLNTVGGRAAMRAKIIPILMGKA